MADVKPGYYPCELNGCGGHIQFPHPLTWTHVRAWWEKVIEPLKEKSRLDFEYTDLQWKGARDLILDFGEWSLTGPACAPGNAKADEVPAEVATFVIESAEAYIVPFLHPRLRRMLSTTIL